MNSHCTPQQCCEENQGAVALLHKVIAHLSRHVKLFGMDDADEEIFSDYADLCRSLGVPVCQELLSAAKACEAMDDECDVAKILLRIKLKPGNGASREEVERHIRPGWRLIEFDRNESKEANKGVLSSIIKKSDQFQSTILLECRINVYNKDDFGSDSVAMYVGSELPVSKSEIENIVMCEAFFEEILYKICLKQLGNIVAGQQ